MKLSEKILEVLKNNGFSHGEIIEQTEEYCIELSQFTPAGEDWWVIIWFDGNDESFINSFRKYVESYDVDDEATLYIESRGKNGIPSSIRTLVEDAEWKEETLGETLKDLEDINFEENEDENNNEDNVITLFVLDPADNKYLPVIYAIPLNKQLKVERLARTITEIDNFTNEFENLLKQNNIEYEYLDIICASRNRQKDWIDDKIPRVIVG